MELNQGTPKKEQRNGHSTACLNVNPIYIRPKTWKNLPGELGKTFNYCRKRDVSRDPLFVKLRELVGRCRDFRLERRNLMNAMFQLLLSRHDLATGIVELDMEAMATELSKSWEVDLDTGESSLVDKKVTISRISRFINEVMIPFGLCYVHSDGDDDSPDSGLVWDRVNGFWFPKVIVLTAQFYRIAGADLDKLYDLAQQQLVFRNNGLAEEGEVISLSEARKRKRKQIFERAWQVRKNNIGAARRRKKLGEQSLDERRHQVAADLIKQMPTQVAAMTPDEFDREVWRRLNQMDMGVSYSPPDTLQ